MEVFKFSSPNTKKITPKEIYGKSHNLNSVGSVGCYGWLFPGSSTPLTPGTKVRTTRFFWIPIIHHQLTCREERKCKYLQSGNGHVVLWGWTVWDVGSSWILRSGCGLNDLSNMAFEILLIFLFKRDFTILVFKHVEMCSCLYWIAANTLLLVGWNKFQQTTKLAIHNYRIVCKNYKENPRQCWKTVFNANI